jgi:type II secretory pathway component PulF
MNKQQLFFLSFPVKDQINFTKRLSMLLRSGMPIVQALSMLTESSGNSSATHITKSLCDDIERGIPFSKALTKFEKQFGLFYINIVHIGELSGTLPENLDYIAQELKKKNELKKQVMGALIYPAIIVSATIGITTLLVLYIFPKILPVFLSLKTELPLSTRVLLGFNTFMSTYGWLALVTVIGSGIFFIMGLRSNSFCLMVDRLILCIPLFGSLSRYYNLATICRTLGILLKSDVRIVQAIDIASLSCSNRAYRKALATCIDGVVAGQPLSTQLQQNPAFFPPLVTQMIHVGETTGGLSHSLLYLSDMYEEEIQMWTKNLTTILEPLLMLTMGLLVGFIAVSIITPIYGITQNLHQ